MKKITLKIMLLSLGFIPIELSAQIYKQPDFCGQYQPGCRATVEKCRYSGNSYCIIADQIPCSEICPIP
jgi:hypothetical protein